MRPAISAWEPLARAAAPWVLVNAEPSGTNCGTGAGGFQPGNACAKGGTGGGSGGADATRGDTRWGGATDAEAAHFDTRLRQVKDSARLRGYDTDALAADVRRDYDRLRHAPPDSSGNHQADASVAFEQALASAWGRAANATREREAAEFKALKAEHMAKEVPAPKELGESQASVNVVSKRSPEQVRQLASKILGRQVELHQLASLVGAPDDAVVSITPGTQADRLTIRVNHPDYKAKRTLGLDIHGKSFIHNDEFWMNKASQGGGLGTQVFAKQVENAQKLGVAYIDCHAAKDNPRDPANPHNGYYTWPRFGYDQSVKGGFLPQDLRERVAEKFPHAESVLDVMMTKGGQDFWKEHGTDLVYAKFDLAPGSRSLKVFHAYLAERSARQKPPTGNRLVSNMAPWQDLEIDDAGDGIEEPYPSPDDEAALTAAWEKLRSAGGGVAANGLRGCYPWRPLVNDPWQPLANESFFASCQRDDKGHCTSGSGGSGGKSAAPSGAVGAKARRVVSRIADRVRAGFRAGVQKALDGLDEASKNGASLILGGIASRSPATVHQGLTQVVSSIFHSVHQEVFEEGLAQHSFPGAAAVAGVASKAAAAGQQALVKGVSRALKALGIVRNGRWLPVENAALSRLDEAILGVAVDQAMQAVAMVYRELGVQGKAPDAGRIRARILEYLSGAGTTQGMAANAAWQVLPAWQPLANAGEGGWRTIEGRHVYFGDDGQAYRGTAAIARAKKEKGKDAATKEKSAHVAGHKARVKQEKEAGSQQASSASRANDLIRKFKAGGGKASMAETKELVGHLEQLTADQLRKINEEHGLRADADLKGHLSAKIAASLAKSRQPPTQEPRDDGDTQQAGAKEAFAEKEKMRTAAVISVKNLGGGANESKVVTLADGTKAVFKPMEGEDHGLRDSVPDKFYQREAAASSLASLVGMNDLVPATVVRTINGKVGSLQKFVPNATAGAEHDEKTMYDGEKDRARAGAFDYLINNQDRHEGNWLLDRSGKLKLIDHGLAFPNQYKDETSMSLLGGATSQHTPIPKEFRNLSAAKLEKVLREHDLGNDVINAAKQRLADLKESETFGDLDRRYNANVKSKESR